jgi:predicted MFS family arabinose efflux permease
MKITARPILRRWGFRKVMVGNALISGAFLLSYAAFRPGIPSAAILVLLLIGGFFRSLQFTSTNTLAFADVPPTRISRATSLTSTAQQLSISMGVALGATLLHLTLLWRGTSDLAADDFWPAFVVVALLSSASVFIYARLAPDAGAEVSGRALVAPSPIPKEADD